jgi:RimJ/RimL family protein N-acetyltransferase
VLRPIGRDVALALLEGRVPQGVVFATGYPSQFSLEVMQLVAGARGGEGSGFGPFFMVRKADGAVVGEIGASLDRASATAQVGYAVVEPCWGRGYATEALGALLAHLLAEPGVRRVVAETLVGHVASRRVLEKAGMRGCGQRVGEEDGEPVALVVYQALAGSTGACAEGGTPAPATHDHLARAKCLRLGRFGVVVMLPCQGAHGRPAAEGAGRGRRGCSASRRGPRSAGSGAGSRAGAA